MTKLYYNDPLKASWMAREFGVRYSNGDHEICVIPFVDALAEDKIYYIHPDSLHILQPVEGDVLRLVIGLAIPPDVRYYNWERIERSLAIEYGKAPSWHHTGIIRRNGKAFFMPEVE